MDQSYSKKEKLKSRKLIEKVFAEGKTVSKYPLKLVYLPVSGMEEILQTGVSVPKRLFKKAVDRNRIKRLMREAYRLNKHEIIPHLKEPHAFMFIYTSKDMPDFAQLNTCVIKIIKKLLQNDSSDKPQQPTIRQS